MVHALLSNTTTFAVTWSPFIRGITVVLSVGHKHIVLRADLPNMRRKRQGGL